MTAIFGYSLDGAVEAAIQGTSLTLRKDITIIVVAHRLTTVRGCDMLYWLQGGEVCQHGSVGEVLPEYEKFLQVQAVRSECQEG